MEDYMEHKVKTKVEKYVTIAFKIFFAILAAIAFALLFGYVIMWLWNWLMPSILGLTTITYWQAVGVLVLSKLLFGGLGDGPPGTGGKKSRKRFRDRMRDKKCSKNGFSKWELYDDFWKEEGEKAFNEFIERKRQEKQ